MTTEELAKRVLGPDATIRLQRVAVTARNWLRSRVP